MAEFVRYAVDRGVATVTLDSPRNRNALTAQSMAELGRAIEAGLAERDVRVIVLDHTGPAFCSGMDLSAARAAAAAGQPTAGPPNAGHGETSQPVTAFPRLLTAVWNSSKPVIARVAGAARAGGVGLVAAADIAVAATSATFAFTEVRIGLVPAVISVIVLPALLPRAAHELFLTGEVFDGTRAAQVGLVNSAVGEAEVDGEVDRYVELLLRGAPGALTATKALLRRRQAASLAADFATMTELSTRHFTGPEGQEGLAAFAAKRLPSWAGVESGQHR